ncbi:MAG TPA: hypothetical protein VGB64_04475 [Actinomycetota bacterium]
MRKALGLLGALAVVAGIGIPASAAPGGPCQGQVDAMCSYRAPNSTETRQCDYWINDPAIQRNFCGELPGLGPIV